MKYQAVFLLAVVAVSASAQLGMAGGVSEMDCSKGSDCEKKFLKFVMPKMKEHLGKADCHMDWMFCHIESGTSQIVSGMKLEFTAFAMDGCQGYKKCQISSWVQGWRPKGEQLRSFDIECVDDDIANMPGLQEVRDCVVGSRLEAKG